MEISFTKRRILITGLSKRDDPKTVHLGYFLFSEARCFFGVLQPYNMLKKILLRGRLIDCDGNLLEWKSFFLKRLQYDQLKLAIRANPEWGGEVDSSFRGSSEYWQRWAILRSLQPGKILYNRLNQQQPFSAHIAKPATQTVTAPLQTSVFETLQANKVVSVNLEVGEEVEWIWRFAPPGKNFVSGYTINKKSGQKISASTLENIV